MWCSVCQNDVATEVGADNRRVSCSNCGHLLSGNAGATPEQAAATTAPSSGPDTRAEEARQLLDRWAKGHFFDPYGPPKKTGVNAEPSIAVHAENDQRSDTEQRAATVAGPGHLTAQPVASSVPDVSSVTAVPGHTELRGRETVDEHGFAADPQNPSAPEKLEVTPSEPQRPVGPNSVESDAEAHAGPSTTSINPPEGQAAAPGPGAAASAAELDRLTREIMDRVSKITEARKATGDQQTRDRASNEKTGIEQPSVVTGKADSIAFAEQHSGSVEDASQGSSSSGHENSRHAEIAAFDGPIKLQSDTSTRTDAPHQPAGATATSRYGASPATAPAGASPTPAASAQASPTSSVSGGWYSNIGQMLAYLGIISLTAGTCGVIVSYFGGPANYAPYGWLGATIGQMLLFLGIVTLISAGMEQTSQELRQAVDQRMDEVTQRLDLIGSRMMRIEEASSDGPPRPHLLSPTEQDTRHTERPTAQRVGSDE